jgi:MFS family permease
MDERRKSNWLFVIVGVLVCIVVIAFGRHAYGVILPYMREGLSITYQKAGFLGTATSLGYLGMVVFAGPVSAKFGAKNTILMGITLVMAGFIFLTMTPSYWLSVIFMILLGAGTAFTFTPLVALVTGWFPTKKGLVIGYVNSGSGIGMLLVGMLVPYFNKIYPVAGWRIVWGIFAVIGIAVLITTWVFMRNPQVQETTGTPSLPTPAKKIYTDRKVLLIAVIYGIVGITFIVQSIFMMSFMLEAGLSSSFAGKLIAINGVLSVFSAPVWGGVSDRLGRRMALIIVMSLSLIATLIPIVFPTSLGFIVNNLIIGAIATGLFTMVQALGTEQVQPRDMPVAFSYVTFYFAFGQFIGPTVAGSLIDHGGGFKSAFLFSSVCLGAGLFLALRLKKSKTKIAEGVESL